MTVRQYGANDFSLRFPFLKVHPQGIISLKMNLLKNETAEDSAYSPLSHLFFIHNYMNKE
jgi:glycerol-3-phosphate responsive antiterminator